MKFYFNCNNKTQARALRDCGVKNVMISYQYCHEAFDDYASMFDGIGVISGKIDNVDTYYDWARLNRGLTDFIAQYDIPMDIRLTMKYYEKALKSRISVSPILTSNYLQHLSQIKLTDFDRTILLGKMTGNIEEDEQVRKLPSGHNYHGLAKGRWVTNPLINIISVNSSTWLSGVRGRKTDVWDYHIGSVLLGKKGKGDRAILERVLDNHKDELEQCQIHKAEVMAGEYSALLKLPIALYYIPMLSSLGAASQNFQTS